MSKNKSIVSRFNGKIQIQEIAPLTQNQVRAFDAYNDGYNLLMHGVAGTGKTFCALYLALKEIFSGKSFYKKIVIVRSAVPTRTMGFLPGRLDEKLAEYEVPYKALMSEICGSGGAYEVLKKHELIEFMSTSYVRGITLTDCIVIVDEMNNLNFHELDSIITRVGQNCKIIFCGDYRQTDFTKGIEKKGIHDFMDIIENLNSFECVEFDVDDIVRSDLVREYLIEKYRQED